MRGKRFESSWGFRLAVASTRIPGSWDATSVNTYPATRLSLSITLPGGQPHCRQLDLQATKPDGLTIGNFIGNLISQQLFGGHGIEFDARSLNGIGVPVKDHVVVP